MSMEANNTAMSRGSFIRASLRWDSERNRRRRATATNERCWSVQEVTSFLFDRLIPKVTSANWVSGPLLFAQFAKAGLQVDRSSGHEDLAAANFDSLESAIDAVEKMQSRYISDHDQFVNASVVASTFQLLNFLLETNQLPAWSVEYISVKLSCFVVKPLSRPSEFVTTMLRTLNNPKSPESISACIGEVVDNALRCVLEILRNGTANQTMDQEWVSRMRAFELVVKDFNERNYLARMWGEDFEEM
jgi:hypothetical protein